ncbi:uncharacterized protein NECHADRAFT_76639 [Fusarium vanettenii 77-13-4]|uniref:Uncharacterized protein n=1 Tax=Fusarium vanettenii (strain ATCC MYA-4622 / CBS 123669 / FGSC 9596 / NRRL 45880 / 77-13-4) TaxID=660122 RepID=C7Z4U4_FUSV7|nr:uncharacterized protein NECHADRAFT_76639 [Fusarium vanettenii 77-13-4]EEU40407.1 predicted protein [Fusarium vanettenii 77-13-4]
MLGGGGGGGNLDLSKLTPAQLHALGAGLAGRPSGPAAGVTKTQTTAQPGLGTSKFARARREKAAAKAASSSSSSTTSVSTSSASAEKEAIRPASAAEVPESEPEPKPEAAAAKSSEAVPEVAVDYIDCNLGPGSNPSLPASSSAALKTSPVIIPVFEKTAAAATSSAAVEVPKPEATAAKSSEAMPEAAVDFVDCSLGEKVDEEMTGA